MEISIETLEVIKAEAFVANRAIEELVKRHPERDEIVAAVLEKTQQYYDTLSDTTISDHYFDEAKKAADRFASATRQDE